MAQSRGKAFESVVKENWMKTFPNSFFYRIPDQVSGYLTTSQNPCDFIGFTDGMLFLIECKSTQENTLNFSKIRQYERLLRYKDIPDTYPGVLVWFELQDKVIWFPIAEIEKIKKDNFKSLRADMLNNYQIIEIPSIKKRVFMESNFTVLLNLKEKE